MKKLGIIFAIIAMFALIGCQTTGGAAASSGGGTAPFIVDLSKLTSVKSENNVKIEEQLQSGNYQTQSALKNQTPFAKAWDDFFVLLPASALPSDFSKYARLTMTCKYFDAAGAEIEQQDSQCLVVVVYDMKGDLRGPQSDPGPNTPVKELNVGGYSATIHTDKGKRITFKQIPQGVMFQNNSGSKVAFIELTGMVFHNGNYESPK
jgi:hypothetical protein